MNVIAESCEGGQNNPFTVEPAFEEPSDRKRTKVLFCLLLGCVLAVVVFVIYPREPSYNGKSVSEWLDTGWEELESGHIPVRSSAMGHALERMGAPVVPHLLKTMSYRESQTHQLQTLLNRHQSVVQFEFADKKRARAAAAALGFVALGDEGRSGFPVLTNWLFQSQPTTTMESLLAAWALAGTDEGVDLLIAETLHTNRFRRLFAVESLGRAQWQAKVADVLMNSLADPELIVRINSARALGELRYFSLSVISALRQSLFDSNAVLRKTSAQALSRSMVPHQSVIEALTLATNDTEADVRFAAAWAIEDLQSGTESIQPLLLESLHISDSHKQWDTLVTLGYRGTTNEIIIAELKKMAANDPSSHVRATAQWALDTFSSRSRK